MTVHQRFRLIAIAASVLLLGISGCGFAPTAAAPEATLQTQSTTPVAQEIAALENAGSPEEAIVEKPAPKTVPASRQSYRNPFRPPTVKTRTVTPQQVESGNIRLLGIAKRDEQHIALVETSGEFHKAVVGDFILEWEVLTVTESETTLRRGLEQMSLRIR